MRTAPLAVILCLCALAGGLKSAPPSVLAQAPRDLPSLAVIGTASVTGTVVADDTTRAPIKRAQVTLTRTGIEDIRTTSTDERGRFAFSQLPAGTYVLRASKGGYLGTNYGALQAGMPGSAIPLRDAEQFTATPMALAKGGVIAGRIVDRYGRPAATAVEAVPTIVIDGERRRRLTSDRNGVGIANAHGEYRLFGLPPGEYVLYANAQNLQRLIPAITPAELAWAQKPTDAPPPRERTVIYAPTVFPGTADLSGAVTIVLGRGEERTGMDFTVQSVPATRVTGIVTGPDGVPVPNALIRRLMRQPNPIFSESEPTTRTNADGVFTLTNVPPGDSTIIARGAPANITPVAVPGGGRGNSVPQTWWGSTEITATGNDIVDRTIRLQPGLSLSGRMIVRSGSQPAPRPLPHFRITLMPKVPGAYGGGVYTTTSAADGSFGLDGMMPGTFLVSSSVTSATWAVQSIVHAGQDVADAPLELRVGDDLSDFVVTLSDQLASLTGTMTDSANRPTPQFYVLMFPANRALWTQDSRRIQAVRADVKGGYTVSGLPAGEYYVSAATTIETALQYDASYLELFVPVAIKMTIGEGEKKVQDLKIGG